MESIKEDRFYLIENDKSVAVFDIETNYVVSLSKTHRENLLPIINVLEKANLHVNPQVLKTSKYEDGSNLAININLTPACNLKCTYCFAQGGNYGSLEKTMKGDIIHDLAKLIQNNITGSRKVRFEFFGGEPLLNFNTIKEILQFSRDFSKRESVDFIHRISTNLTYMDDEIVNALGENNFIVSISIDGSKPVQDSLRPFKNNDGSFDVIMANIKRLRKRFPGLTIVGRMTIAQKEHSVFDNIKELITTDYFDYISIYPASIKNSKDMSNAYQYYFDDDIKQQLQYVIANYSKLFELSPRFKGILEYEKIYDQILNGKTSVSHCAAGGTYFTISGDKSVVPCHRLCGKKEFTLNTESGILQKDIITEWSGTVDEHPQCSKCWARYICGGGCKQEHFSANGDIKSINTHSCEYHKFVIKSLIRCLDGFSDEFNHRNIQIDDLFVYCGRPVVPNRRNGELISELQQFEGVKVL